MSFENGTSGQWKQSNTGNLFKPCSADSDKYTASTMDSFNRTFMLFLESGNERTFQKRTYLELPTFR